MGQRLTRIYTRTGDDGTTGLGDGSRLPKDHVRVEAIGAVDELNSHLGAVLSQGLPEPIRLTLVRVQHELFDLGGELAVPGRSVLTGRHVARLESELDGYNADLPSLREFVLPGGTPGAATCHLARAHCRLAERRLVALARQEEVNAASSQYLNRLSDLLFVMARVVARWEGGHEVFWHPQPAEP